MSDAPASGSGFRDHFSGHAGAYATARPGYPDALFDWLAAQCTRPSVARSTLAGRTLVGSTLAGRTLAGRTLVWDAGCGNGQASVALAAHFDAVFASDPSAPQIANAISGSIAHANLRYAVEPAEHCSLADASADLVTVAQAYHWFAHEAFCAQVRRVLRPGGVVALWTYAESIVSPQVDAIFDQLNNGLVLHDWPPEREHVINRYRDLPFPFELIEAPAFEMTCHWTLPQYLAYLRSWSATQRYLIRTGQDPVAQVEQAMTQAWGEPDTRRWVTWPLGMRVGRR